jgi:Fe-Mn family superoxide dismutase
MRLSLAATFLLVGSASAWSTLTMKTDSGSSLSKVPTSRRNFGAALASVGAAIVAPAASKAYSVPDLPYPYEALEPYIDAPTMKIHHDKHHGTYVANINKATEGKEPVPILDLMENALDATPVRNSGGGHYNHAFFWDEMLPGDQAAKTKPSAQLEELINKSFGSMDEMKAKFEAQAAPGAVFGSGWVWVCVNAKGDALEIVGTPNQDNPLMKGVTKEIMFPILGIDVWEHAYYLKYQNRRPEYVSNWWSVVNWDKVSENCAYAVENKKGISVRD